MRTRLIIGIACIFTIFLITQLSPTKSQNQTKDSATAELQQIDNFNFNQLASRLWEEGDKHGAVVALETIIATNGSDKKQATGELIIKKAQISQDQTLFGRIKALGTTEADETSLKGQLWDLFNTYGNSIILEPNTTGENLDRLGAIASIYPEAGEKFNVYKLLFQSGALNGKMAEKVNQSLMLLNSLKADAGNLTKITQAKQVLDQLAPIEVLVAGSSSWYQVKLFLSNCSSFAEVSQLAKIISAGDNNTKLAQLITVLGKRDATIRETFSYIRLYGQQGLNNIHKSIVKGSKGIQFVLENPSVPVSASLAVKTETERNLFDPLKEKMQEWKDTYGNLYETAKNLLISLLLFITILCWIPKKLFLQVDNQSVNNYIARHYLFIVTSVCFIIFMILMVNQLLGEPETAAINNTVATTTSTVTGTNAGAVQPQAVTKATASSKVLSPISWSVMLIFLILHAIVGSNTKSKIFKLDQEAKPTDTKIKLLKNIEHDLDLSVYIGLAGTVTSFIIMQFDPSGSRILAYSSTLAGIIISCVLKTLYYQPLLNSLVESNNKAVLLNKKAGEDNE